MLRMQSHLMSIVLVATIMGVSADSARAADEQQRQLIGILQSDAPPAEKAITCKRLAVYGTEDAVPALAPLLTDPELASWARIALEVIPDPSADEALHAAMETVDGRLLIGVINSIGVRRDVNAVDSLARRLTNPDPQVASAAALALGRIGGEAATKTLRQALAETSGDVRSAVAEGCVLSAERLLAEDKVDEAAALYDEVRQSDVPEQRILESTRGAILARKSAGVPLLVEQLKSPDKRRFFLGLSTARELSGSDVTQALVTELGRTSPERQALLVLVLADRADTSALPAVLQTAKNGTVPARIAALDVLKHLGNASCVPTLLDIAAEADVDVAQAAKATLEDLPGDDVDANLADRLSQAEGKTRLVLIELAGLRRIHAVPNLLKVVDDSDSDVRAAALTALGETVGFEDLTVLVTRVTAPKHAADTSVAERALRAACVRMPDREACAQRLTSAMAQAPVSAKRTVLEILSAMGGTKALQTIGEAANDPNPEMQNTATQLLGEWMTVDAAPILLALAEDDGRYRVRALRGYIRLARQFSMPEDDRAEMCRMAMQVAQRDAERKLILEVLERYPSIDALKLAAEAAKVPTLKNDAAATSLAIAQKIGGSVDVQDLLTRIGQEPVKVEIQKAEYGAGSKFKDVTSILKRHARDLPLIILPSSSYNSSFGGDPAPGVVKQLKVKYRMDGKPGEATFRENATILLPMP